MIKFPSSSRRLLGASALALTLAACTVGPDYQPPASETRAGWQGQQQTVDFAQNQQ